jgi:DNA-binding response OmpR family regulator
MLSLAPSNRPLCIIGESDPFLARLLQRFAEKSGFEVQVAQTGEEVLDLIHQTLPALLILEPELPGKVRGWEVASPFQSTIPTLICSWMKKRQAQALVGQISAYLQKPDLRYEDFTQALKSAVKPRNNRKKRTGARLKSKAAPD